MAPIIILLLNMYLWGREYKCNRDNIDYKHKVSECSHENCPADSVYSVYINSVVKDTLLMDKIINAVDNIYNNDSLYNLIKNEYFNAWDINKKYKYFQISVECENYMTAFAYTINEKLISKDFDRTILEKDALTISVMLSFHDVPFGGYYTEYKGKHYYFDNTVLITPTSRTKKLIEADDYDISHLYNFLALNFIYHKGKLYLNPVDDIWHCYQ